MRIVELTKNDRKQDVIMRKAKMSRCGTSKYCPAAKGKEAIALSSGPQHSDRKEFLTKTFFFRRGFRWRAMSLLSETRRFTPKLKYNAENDGNMLKIQQRNTWFWFRPRNIKTFSQSDVLLQTFRFVFFCSCTFVTSDKWFANFRMNELKSNTQVCLGIVYLSAFRLVSPLTAMLRPTLSPLTSSALKGTLCRKQGFIGEKIRGTQTPEPGLRSAE